MSIQPLGVTLFAAVLAANAASTAVAAWLVRSPRGPIKGIAGRVSWLQAIAPILGYGLMLSLVGGSPLAGEDQSPVERSYALVGGLAFLLATLFLTWLKRDSLARSQAECAERAASMGGWLTADEVQRATPMSSPLPLSVLGSFQALMELGAVLVIAAPSLGLARGPATPGVLVQVAASVAIAALPLAIYRGVEAVRRVPASYPAAADALGASRWQVFSRVTWPEASRSARPALTVLLVRTVSLVGPLLLAAWLAAGEAAS